MTLTRNNTSKYHVIYSTGEGWVFHASVDTFEEAVSGWMEALAFSSSACIVKDVIIQVQEKADA